MCHAQIKNGGAKAFDYSVGSDDGYVCKYAFVLHSVYARYCVHVSMRVIKSSRCPTPYGHFKTNNYCMTTSLLLSPDNSSVCLCLSVYICLELMHKSKKLSIVVYFTQHVGIDCFLK